MMGAASVPEVLVMILLAVLGFMLRKMDKKLEDIDRAVQDIRLVYVAKEEFERSKDHVWKKLENHDGRISRLEQQIKP